MVDEINRIESTVWCVCGQITQIDYNRFAILLLTLLMMMMMMMMMANHFGRWPILLTLFADRDWESPSEKKTDRQRQFDGVESRLKRKYHPLFRKNNNNNNTNIMMVVVKSCKYVCHSISWRSFVARQLNANKVSSVWIRSCGESHMFNPWIYKCLKISLWTKRWNENF